MVSPLYLQYEKAVLVAEKLKALTFACRIIVACAAIYKHVEGATRVPWFVVAAIHCRESSLSFKRHLHNGDPLTARTVHIPIGRPNAEPIDGELPYAWYESAIDCLQHRDWKPVRWDTPSTLDFLERYNGLGYRHRGLPSPYLWAFTDQYTKGLFTSDGAFDAEAVSATPGCAAIFKMLEAKQVIQIQ